MSEEIPALIEALSSEDPHVRRDAARALGEARAVEAVPALAEALGRPMPERPASENAELASRAAAAVALGLIGDRRATGALLEASADAFTLGSAASTALGRLSPPPTRELLAAARHADPWRRARAAMSLGEIGDPATLDAVVALLADPEESVRRAAAAACEKMRDPRAVGPLVELLGDGSSSTFVRGYAAMALGALKDPAAVGPLLEATDSEDPLLRRAAARALCRIDDPRSRARLEELASGDPNRSVRDVVARYLDPRPGQRRH